MFNPEESFLFIDLNIDIFLKFEFFFLRSIKLSKPSLTFNISANLKPLFYDLNARTKNYTYFRITNVH